MKIPGVFTGVFDGIFWFEIKNGFDFFSAAKDGWQVTVSFICEYAWNFDVIDGFKRVN